MTVAHWPRRPLPSARPASVPHLEGAALAPLLEGVTENVALHRFRPVPGYGACRFRRACALKRWPRSARSFSLVKTRRPPCACPICRGALGVGVGVGRFYADPQGFRLATPPPGPLSGWRRRRTRDSWPGGGVAYSRTCSRPSWRSCRLLSALRAHGAVDADPQGSRERRRSGDLAEVMVKKKADAPREYVRRLPAQEAGV